MENQNHKKTIMQILPALENGGVERGVVDLCKELKKQNYRPIVVSAGGVMVYQLKEAKIEHITLDVNTKNPFKIYSNIDKIADLIDEYNVDLVHARSRAPMISSYFACKEMKVKLISTVHGNYSLKGLGFKNFFIKRLYNSFMLKADRIIAVSNFIKNYIIENYQPFIKEENLADKITIVQRGTDISYFNYNSITTDRKVDLERKWNLPEDKKIILFPARITSWKGHEFLIEALQKVESDFFCVFVGSDHGHKKFRKKIEQQIIAKNLSNKVKFVGLCKDMPVAYSIANLVISASVRPEAFGRIAIEAQSMKKIIIATKIGGSLETIIDEKTGFLVDVNDSDKMAKLIDRVLNMTKDEVIEMGDVARKHIEENFSSKKMCDATIKVYRDMI